MRILLSILFLILLFSCSMFDANDSSRTELTGSWEIEHFFDEEGEERTLHDDEPLTLRFSKEYELGGDADCNVFGGEYKAKENGDLTIKQLAVTEIACEQPTLGYEYVEALSKVKKFEREEGLLILFYGENGKLIFSERLE